MSIYSLRYCKYHGLTTFTQSSEKSKCICRMCSVERTTMQRKKRKKMLVDLKGGKCEICGYDKCIEALEFHHLDPNKKEINISNSSIHDIELFKKEVQPIIHKLGVYYLYKDIPKKDNIKDFLQIDSQLKVSPEGDFTLHSIYDNNKYGFIGNCSIDPDLLFEYMKKQTLILNGELC